MAADGKNRRPESANLRIWPGVLLIASCAFLLFFSVYAVAYRIHLIPLPEYLSRLLERNGEEQTSEPGETDILEALLPVGETVEGIYYAPAQEEADGILAAMRKPEQYHQRMQITRTTGGTRESTSADLYVQEDCWKLSTATNDTGELYLCDGENLYRENGLFPEGITMPEGNFTPENLLGLPALAMVQQHDSVETELFTSDKYLRVTYRTEEGLEYICRFGLDSGLLVEVQILREQETVLMMYTEFFDLAPAELERNDFFTLPKTEE